MKATEKIKQLFHYSITSNLHFYFCGIDVVYIIQIMKKNEITPKRKELIKNLTQTISKESKKVNGKNTKLIEILQKKLDKIKV